jgi:uncharacterized protein (TIGR03435 family)
VISSVVQSATLSALHLEVQPKTVTKDAYILRATSASSKLLSPSASAKRHIRGYWNGSIRIMNGTMDDLAYELATGLENPVVNETGLAGNFDVQLKFTERNAKSAKAALENVLGLELIQGSQEMSVTVLEVSKQEESKPPPSERTEAPKP